MPTAAEQWKCTKYVLYTHFTVELPQIVLFEVGRLLFPNELLRQSVLTPWWSFLFPSLLLAILAHASSYPRHTYPHSSIHASIFARTLFCRPSCSRCERIKKNTAPSCLLWHVYLSRSFPKLHSDGRSNSSLLLHGRFLALLVSLLLLFILFFQIRAA